MSRAQFDNQCQGCLPILIDYTTGEPMAEDSPEMKLVYHVWGGTTEEERKAFHAVTCQNSRDPAILALFFGVTNRIQNALKHPTT